MEGRARDTVLLKPHNARVHSFPCFETNNLCSCNGTDWNWRKRQLLSCFTKVNGPILQRLSYWIHCLSHGYMWNFWVPNIAVLLSRWDWNELHWNIWFFGKDLYQLPSNLWPIKGSEIALDDHEASVLGIKNFAELMLMVVRAHFEQYYRWVRKYCCYKISSWLWHLQCAVLYATAWSLVPTQVTSFVASNNSTYFFFSRAFVKTCWSVFWKSSGIVTSVLLLGLESSLRDTLPC